jgi:hypothetical protein
MRAATTLCDYRLRRSGTCLTEFVGLGLLHRTRFRSSRFGATSRTPAMVIWRPGSCCQSSTPFRSPPGTHASTRVEATCSIKCWSPEISWLTTVDPKSTTRSCTTNGCRSQHNNATILGRVTLVSGQGLREQQPYKATGASQMFFLNDVVSGARRHWFVAARRWLARYVLSRRRDTSDVSGTGG